MPKDKISRKTASSRAVSYHVFYDGPDRLKCPSAGCTKTFKITRKPAMSTSLKELYMICYLFLSLFRVLDFVVTVFISHLSSKHFAERRRCGRCKYTFRTTERVFDPRLTSFVIHLFAWLFLNLSVPKILSTVYFSSTLNVYHLFLSNMVAYFLYSRIQWPSSILSSRYHHRRALYSFLS